MLLAISATAHSQETTPSEDLALQAYRQGEVERAVDLYTSALSETEDPNHRARLQVQIAWNLFSIGRMDEVRTHLRAALLEEPSLTLLPDYYTPEFLEIFEQARRSNFDTGAAAGAPAPDLEATLATIEDRMASGSDLEGALADVDRLMQAYPRDGRLLPLKVQLLNNLGRTDEAAAIGRTGVTGSDGGSLIESATATDLVLRANRLLEQGDATTALQLARQAVTMSPNNYMALELMAEAAQKVADWKSAEYALKTALAQQPDNIDLRLRLGEIYMATFEASAARDIFTSLTEQYPHSDRPWASLGLLEARLGNTERALDALARAIHENSLLPEVQLANGELLLQAGDAAGALQSLEAAASLMRNDAQLEARLGQAKLAAGRAEQALPHLRAAIAGGFSRPDVERALALALALNDLHAESQRVIQGSEPDAGGDRDLVLGFLAFERGDLDEAEAVFRTMSAARPGDPAVVNLLAATIYSQNRFAEAVSLLERAQELDRESTIIDDNLARARAAQAAELLGENARSPRAVP
jgi:predicted Zn-dependent protease